MGYSILCTARKGPKEATQYLALADHSKTPQYCTSDDPYDLLQKYRRLLNEAPIFLGGVLVELFYVYCEVKVSR